jgi:hypothetical protein
MSSLQCQRMARIGGKPIENESALDAEPLLADVEPRFSARAGRGS